MFDFLEVENGEHKQNLNYQELKKEIPDNQFLTESDIRIINPSDNVKNIISNKILAKYFIIPLFALPPGNRPVLPKHLSSEFWGNIHGKKDISLFVGMPEPFNFQILNILRSVSGYSIIAVPLKEETFKDYYRSVNNKKTEVNQKDNSMIKDIIQNSVYIFIFLFILIGMFSVKIFIEASTK